MPSTEPTETTPTPKEPRFHCRHLRVSGARCRAIALRNQEFCYYHHAARRPAAPQPPARTHPAAPHRGPHLHSDRPQRDRHPHRQPLHRPQGRRTHPLRPADRLHQPPQRDSQHQIPRRRSHRRRSRRPHRRPGPRPHRSRSPGRSRRRGPQEPAPEVHRLLRQPAPPLPPLHRARPHRGQQDRSPPPHRRAPRRSRPLHPGLEPHLPHLPQPRYLRTPLPRTQPCEPHRLP